VGGGAGGGAGEDNVHGVSPAEGGGGSQGGDEGGCDHVRHCGDGALLQYRQGPERAILPDDRPINSGMHGGEYQLWFLKTARDQKGVGGGDTSDCV